MTVLVAIVFARLVAFGLGVFLMTGTGSFWVGFAVSIAIELVFDFMILSGRAR